MPMRNLQAAGHSLMSDDTVNTLAEALTFALTFGAGMLVGIMIAHRVFT